MRTCAPAQRALLQSVAAILKSGKDKAPAATADAPILFHPNIRGRGYYN
jgi:hypothetical protein